jgi:hypothetical protein
MLPRRRGPQARLRHPAPTSFSIGLALGGLSRAARLRLHLGDADQPLRSRRQFRHRRCSCAARAAMAVSRRGARRRQQDHDLGSRHAAPRISACRRLCRCPGVLTRHYSDANTVNVGIGPDVTIAELGKHRRRRDRVQRGDRVQYLAPDGAPRKLLEVSRLTVLGWQARIPLKGGVASTFQWLEHELAQGHLAHGIFREGGACRLGRHDSPKVRGAPARLGDRPRGHGFRWRWQLLELKFEVRDADFNAVPPTVVDVDQNVAIDQCILPGDWVKSDQQLARF